MRKSMFKMMLAAAIAVGIAAAGISVSYARGDMSGTGGGGMTGTGGGSMK
jgi:hypothetical protein